MLRGHRTPTPHPGRLTVKLDIGMLTHDLKTTADYARKVEAMGYDTLWSSETQHDPFLPLAVAATSTSRIKLGLGTQVKGHNERRFSVKWESPGPKMAEAIRGLRAIWDCWQNGTKLDVKGR